MRHLLLGGLKPPPDRHPLPSTGTAATDSRFPPASRVVVGLLGVLAALPALSTSPLTSRPTEMWVRTFEGDVVYVKEEDARVSALCIQIGRTAGWLPSALLDDIRHPEINEVGIVRGMGFSDVDKHVPGWGSSGVSVHIPSLAEEEEGFVEGPTYSFVFHQGRPVFRVEQRWLPWTDDPRIRRSTEIWLPLPLASLRDAPCHPLPNAHD